MKVTIAAGIVGFDAARQQAVERERLVVAARHQALDDVAAHRLQGETLDDERIEAVERAEHALDDPPALGRVGIGIGQRGKVVRHGRRAMHGDGTVPPPPPVRRRDAEQHGEQHRYAVECGAKSGSIGAQGFSRRQSVGCDSVDYGPMYHGEAAAAGREARTMAAMARRRRCGLYLCAQLGYWAGQGRVWGHVVAVICVD